MSYQYIETLSDKLWNDINQMTFLFFSPLPKLGQLSGCDVLTERILQ